MQTNLFGFGNSSHLRLLVSTAVGAGGARQLRVLVAAVEISSLHMAAHNCQ